MATPFPFDPLTGPNARQRRARIAAVKALRPYSRARHLGCILEERTLTTLYQPVVDLGTRDVIGYTAVTRGPAGTPLEQPEQLFDAARELGMVGELDWICRATAMKNAMAAGFGRGLTLFVNVEPDAAATQAPEDVVLVMKNAQRRLRVVLEVTEQALYSRPPELLSWLSYARERWWGVALVDVGATSETLGMLPFVRPDVVKLDSHLVQDVHDERDKRVMDAVHAYAGRTGAAVMAGGIQSKDDAARVQDELGATMGQGWYFGRPGAMPAQLPTPRRVVPIMDAPTPPEPSPWYQVARVASTQSLPADAVVRHFEDVENIAMGSGHPPMVLGSFPHGTGPWGTPEDRLVRIGHGASFVGAVGQDVPRAYNSGWQTSPLEHWEEMVNEWVLLTISVDHAEVVVAFDAGETDVDGTPLLDMCRTSDRSTVATVGEVLLRKLGTSMVNLEGRLVT